MDEIIMEAQQEETPGVSLATVAAVTANGVRIQIDGEDTAGVKEYQCNTAQLFTIGDRVKISKISGSYVVEYKVGAPGETYPTTHGLPSGGTTGQYLRKTSNTDYAVEWASFSEVTVDKLVNSTYTLSLSSSGVLASSGNTATTRIALGSSTTPFFNLYVNGYILLGTNAADSRLGFFGHTPTARQTVASTATVATLITALKAYGLIN